MRKFAAVSADAFIFGSPSASGGTMDGS